MVLGFGRPTRRGGRRPAEAAAGEGAMRLQDQEDGRRPGPVRRHQSEAVQGKEGKMFEVYKTWPTE